MYAVNLFLSLPSQFNLTQISTHVHADSRTLTAILCSQLISADRVRAPLASVHHACDASRHAGHKEVDAALQVWQTIRWTLL